MKTKKAGMWILITILMVSLLAGCSSGSKEPLSTSGGKKTDTAQSDRTKKRREKDEVKDKDKEADPGDTKTDGEDALVEQAMKCFYGIDGNGYDLEKAIALLEEVPDDNGLAWFYYGKCMEREEDNDHRYEIAMECYRKAVENGCLLGYLGEGMLYQNGFGVVTDKETAKSCYETALQGGCTEATFCLGSLEDRAGNYETGKRYYEKAMECDEFGFRNAARVYLGYLHCEQNLGTGSDPAYGLELIQEAADEGYGQGLHAMGYIHYYGLSVEQDYETAATWYRKAIERTGWPSSYLNLATLYLDGDGVEQNTEKAIEYYEKAGRRGVASAYNELGIMYINGEVVEQSEEKAAEYYRLAMEGGHAWGAHNLAGVYIRGSKFGQDVEQALSFYQTALSLSPEDEALHESVTSSLRILMQNGRIDEATMNAVLNGTYADHD